MQIPRGSFRASLVALLATVAALGVPAADATNGYFSHGYSMYESGMGGAGVAYPQDCLAAATNPAGMVLVGNCELIGVTYFRPQRSAVISGSGIPGGNRTYDGNGNSDFFIPQLGYNRMLNPNMSLGISVYGNGGMNTSYTGAIPLFGTTPAGVDLEQLIVAPTLAWKIDPSDAIGLSVAFAYQMFSAYGLQNFDNPFASTSVGHVTNNGQDTATGWGVRIGWIGQISPNVTLGATYQTQMSMSKFSKYQGLFANQGEFDIPANYAVGVAIQANPKTTVVVDVQRILYSGVPAIANPMSNILGCPAFGGSAPSACLGGSNGPGFGWRDITVWKLGIAYRVNPTLTLRAGLNHSDNPIPASDVLFNVLAPGVVTDHLSLGATWEISPFQQLTVAYMHAFANSVTGPIPAAFGGGTASISLSEDSLGVAYRWTF
jgi:long-chain fatty acid transport protein